MSNHLISEVYKRKVGSLARKALMVLLADKASDDGSGIWASKLRMADELGATKQTVLNTLKSLMDDGLIREVGTRPCARGYTVEYAINPDALRALPLVPSHAEAEARVTSRVTSPRRQKASEGVISDAKRHKASHVTESDGSKDLTGQRCLPQGSKGFTPGVKEVDPNPPRTPHEPFPSDTSYPQGGSRCAPAALVMSIQDRLSVHFARLSPAAQLVRWEEAFNEIGRNPQALPSRELDQWREWLDAIGMEASDEPVMHHAQRLYSDLCT